ncbi:MAG: DNA-directed DNA polymerase [Methanomicrobiales archaeon]|nr:DNA-directed DNA polymerase [Methanomicrobiales archaeon]
MASDQTMIPLVESTGAPVRLAIMQIEYSNTPDGPVLHIFGRGSDGQALRIEATGFLPYFYAPLEQVDQRPLPPTLKREGGTVYHSLRGVPLRRLIAQKPTDVRDLREGFDHYEADIPFTIRFMIDCRLTSGVEAPAARSEYHSLVPADLHVPPRVCIMDIECEDERGFPAPERDRIICITCWDSYARDYTTLLLASGTPEPDFSTMSEGGGLKNGCFRKGVHRIMTFKDERDLLRALASFMQERDPDILAGWNFLEFDLRYLIGRMEALGLAADSLARLPGRIERNAIRGRVAFDLLEAYRKLHGARLESYRLDAVAEDELGEKKVRYPGTLSSLWRDHPAQLVEYNFKDVELCVGIDRKNRILNFYLEIARYVGCPLDRTLNSSNVIDIYILRKAHGQFVLPSKGFAAADEFEGATVFDPTRGIKENVVVLDLKSLYPMAMMTINASPETKDPLGEYRAPNGVRFKKSPDGLTRSILSELLGEREAKKRLRDSHQIGSPEYMLYDMQQNVIKVIMNTYYGVSGYARFRLYDREIGAAITSVGRAIIEHTRRVIEGMGYHVLYGDTDSCMVNLPVSDVGAIVDSAREIEKKVNESYDEFSREVLNAERHYFSIKFEKIYRRFFQAGRKKRYAGLLVWKEGQAVDDIDIVGFEIRRSDSPHITRIVQKEVIEMILRGKGYVAVKSYLGEVIRNYRAGRYSLEEIGIPGGIGKDLDQYETDDAHVRGAKYANIHLGATFSRGSKPKRVYIKHVKAKYPQTDVLCFEYADQVPSEFVIDLETMLEKTVKQPISRIIEAVGWKWQDVDPSHTTLAQFGF